MIWLALAGGAVLGFIGGVTWVWWLAGTPSDPDYG